MNTLIIKLFSASLALCLLLAGCGDTATDHPAASQPDESIEATDTPAEKPEFKIPDNLMSEAEYRAKVDALAAEGGYAEASEDYVKNMDTLKSDLYNMLTYNQSSATFTGTAYYVSNSGNDQNDGLTPETAWATLDKVNSANFKAGDAVLFERGGLWRGSIRGQNGVAYTAYGTGHKPKIYCSIDGTELEWEKSEYENVWVTKKRVGTDNVGLVVFNVGDENEAYGEHQRKFEDLKTELDFMHHGTSSAESNKNGRLYVYCKAGNPAEVFDSIEISINASIMEFAGTQPSDITLWGLEMDFGTDFFFDSDLTNIYVKYCSFRWIGGQWTGGEGIRYCGGGGAWQNCDTLIFEHCYLYQQFDSGTTPQYTGKEVSVFKNYRMTDCLIEKVEYPFEYFHSNFPDSLYKDFYIAYNLIYDTGGGFGDKRYRSACIRGRQYTPAVNCIIEKNIYDRSQTQSIGLVALNVDGSDNFDNIFTMRNNVFLVTRENNNFAQINDEVYKANEADYKKYVEKGYEQTPTMRVIK